MGQTKNLAVTDSLVESSLSQYLNTGEGFGLKESIISDSTLSFTGETYLLSRLSLALGNDFPNYPKTDKKLAVELAWAKPPVVYTRDTESGDIIREINPVITILFKDITTGTTTGAYSIEGGEYRDTIASENLPYLNDPNYSFTNPATPPAEPTLWDTVLEPVIVVGSAILSVWLLFSIRS